MKTFPAGEKICQHQRKNIPRQLALQHSQRGGKIFLEKNPPKKFTEKNIPQKNIPRKFALKHSQPGSRQSQL